MYSNILVIISPLTPREPSPGTMGVLPVAAAAFKIRVVVRGSACKAKLFTTVADGLLVLDGL